MIDKKRFRQYVRSYMDFNRYLDRLADLSINIWENDELSSFTSYYTEMLYRLVDLDPQDPNTPLESFLYFNYGTDYSDKMIDELYNEIDAYRMRKISENFYSVEDDPKECIDFDKLMKEFSPSYTEIDEIFNSLIERL